MLDNKFIVLAFRNEPSDRQSDVAASPPNWWEMDPLSAIAI